MKYYDPKYRTTYPLLGLHVLEGAILGTVLIVGMGSAFSSAAVGFTQWLLSGGVPWWVVVVYVMVWVARTRVERAHDLVVAFDAIDV